MKPASFPALPRRRIAVDSKYKIALERLLYNRNKEVFQGQADRLYLQNEKDELEKLKQNLNQNAMMIRASFSGLVVWDDQNADIKYLPENMGNLTPDDLILKDSDKQNTAEENRGSLGLIRAEEAFTVKKDQTFARLVNNEKSWYVCCVDNKKAGRIQNGNALSLKVDGLEGLIPGMVESVQPMGDEPSLLYPLTVWLKKPFICGMSVADLIVENIEGLKIPVRSLANRNIQ